MPPKFIRSKVFALPRFSSRRSWWPAGFDREAIDLNFEHIQQREEHWAIVDLKGKAGHTRTIPMPEWVKALLDDWTREANLTTGKLVSAGA